MPAETEAGSAAAAADASTGNRRTTGNSERDSVFDRNNQDVGIDEAYQLAALHDTRAWNLNGKQLFDETLKALGTQEKELTSHLSELRTVRLKVLENMTSNGDNNQKAYLRHLNLTDRSVFTSENELEAALAAKSGVQADAFVALLAKAIADAVNTK